MAAEISVIVPIFNTGAHARAAVESLLAQSFTDFEALLIDDGSTDGSGLSAFEAAAGDPRFRLLRQSNAGLSEARNRGLSLAEGRFIAFLDGDDRYTPQFLAQMHHAALSEGADLVACAFTDCFADGSQRLQSALRESDPPPGLSRWPLQTSQQIFAHLPSAWNKLWRRSFLAEQRFEPGIWFEDHAFYLQAALRAPELIYLSEPLYLQTRGRPGQITTTDSDRLFEQFTVLDRVQEILHSAGLPLPDAGFCALTSTLLAERATALRSPGRRQRWLQVARSHLAGRGLPFEERASPSLGRALAGELPVCLVADLRGCAHLPAAWCHALATQDIAAFSILCICDPARPDPDGLAQLQNACADRPLVRCPLPAAAPLPALWRAALSAQTQAAAFLFLTPGDLPDPSLLRLLADARGRSGAEIACCGYLAPSDGCFRPGLGNPAALSPAPTEGHLLSAAPDSLPFEPLACVQLIERAALHAALPPLQSPWPEADLARTLARNGARTAWLDYPGLRPAARPEFSAPSFRKAVLAHLATLPPEQRRQSFSRALRLLRDFGFNLRDRRGRLAFGLCLLRVWLPLRFRPGFGARLLGPLDPAFPARLRPLLPRARAKPL